MAADRFARRFLPQIGHWSENTFINQDGSLGAVFHLSGFASELAGAHAIDALKMSQNALARNLSDPRVEIWDHFTRQAAQEMTPLPEPSNWFAARFDAAYRETQGSNLFRNDVFVTVIFYPQNSLRSGIASLFGGSTSDAPQAAEIPVQEFEDILGRLSAGLERFGARRLGLREQNGVVFSEIFEAFHLIINNHFRPLALVPHRMGRLIVPERVVFGHREWQVMGEGRASVSAILCFHNYPTRTAPTMFDELKRASYGVTITHSWLFGEKAKELGFLAMRVKQMQSGNDSAKSQMQELVQDEDDVMSGRSVYGSHHCSVAIHAGTLEQLDRSVAHAQSRLADAGVTAVRETDAIKAAFAAQLPGNSRWRTRPGRTKSLNWVSMAARSNVPRGYSSSRWGAPIIALRTTANTEYAFHFQVQGSAQIPAEDLGNCMLIGPAGSGKTGLLGTVSLLALRNPAARVVVVDKDYGLSIMVRAAGGSYLVLPSGEPSGLAPLCALTAADTDFLVRFVRNLVVADGQGDLSSDEDEMLQRAVSRQMEMPQAMRSLAGVAVMLGQRSRNGAAARLRKWCRGERLGWAFDNARDDLAMDTRIVGFDTTALLKDEMVCSPTLSYLFYRTRQLINGKPLVLAIDEFWQTDRVAAFREENNDHLKTIRKNEGVVILATQSARDALNSPNAHTFKQQIPTKVFFGDDSASRADLVEGMGLTSAEYLAVTQILPNMRHTFLMKRPGGSVLCRFDLGAMRDKVAVISGRRSTYDLTNRLIARHGGDPRAWVPEFERRAASVLDAPSALLEAAE